MRTWCQEFVVALEAKLASWQHDKFIVSTHWSLSMEDDYDEDMPQDLVIADPRSEPEIFVHRVGQRMSSVHARVHLGEDCGKRYGFMSIGMQGHGGPQIQLYGDYDTWLQQAFGVLIGFFMWMKSFEDRGLLGKPRYQKSNLAEIHTRVDANACTQQDVYNLLHDLSDAEEFVVALRAQLKGEP